MKPLLYDRIKKQLRHINTDNKLFESTKDIIVNVFNEAKVIIIESLDIQEIEDFKNVKLPFDNFYTEFKSERGHVGVHMYCDTVAGLKSSTVYNLTLYFGYENEVLPISAIIDTDKLPRFYVACPTQDKCNKVIHPTFFGSLVNARLCMKTPRTAPLCENSQALALHTAMLMIYNVARYINETPNVVYRESKEHTRTKQTDINQTNRPRQPSKYIYIRKEIPVYAERNAESPTRRSPSPHERRGHTRHYRDKAGNVVKEIWIEKVSVKGGTQSNKYYKIKGHNKDQTGESHEV